MRQGRALAEAIRVIGVTEVTYCRCWNEYGGLAEAKIMIEQ